MDDALRPVNSDRRQSVSIELILPWEMRLPVVTDFVTLLADFVTHSIVGNGLAIDDRAPAGECRAGRLWTYARSRSSGRVAGLVGNGPSP